MPHTAVTVLHTNLALSPSPSLSGALDAVQSLLELCPPLLQGPGDANGQPHQARLDPCTGGGPLKIHHEKATVLHPSATD